MRLSNAEKMYAADAAAIGKIGIPSLTLMQSAAEGLVQWALEREEDRKPVFAFCGPGNNGGDGVAAAAMLLERGVPARALLVGNREKMTADCRAMEQRLVRAGGVLEDFDPADPELPEALSRASCAIDAIFGIGLRRPVAGLALEAVRMLNDSGLPVVAADVPSGISADTGEVLGEAVRCAATVTFSMAKPGHYLEPGCVYAGEVRVHDIGIPEPLLRAAETPVRALLPGELRLPKRDPLSHKGDHGKILIVGGSTGYTGAPSFASRAAVRAGAGLVWLGVPREIWPVTAVKNDEAMPFPLPCDEKGRLTVDVLPELRRRWKDCGVLAMGPGLGRSDDIVAVVSAAVEEFPGVLVLDADALWAVSREEGLLRRARGTVVVTPHMGEFARMGGDTAKDRLNAALAFAGREGCVTVLKGHHTLAAFPDGSASIAAAGTAGMAKGGSGDVLTGILAGFAGQLPLREAVETALIVHAAAGEACAERLGEYAMTPSDVIEALPEILREMA